jgi:hypothetical protein
MRVWYELIAESRKLEEIASKIQQGESVGLSREEIEKLSADYYLWYGKCLSLLPEDLRQRFRSEYDGAWYAPKIKKFFEASTEPYIFRPNDEQGRQIWSYWAYPYERTFAPCILSQRQILIEARTRQPKTFISSEAIEKVELLVRRFDLVARELARRHDKRPTLIIEDEYDVQDLFRAMLRMFFDDIRSEDPAPSVGGKSSRIDFLLKREQIVVEIKMTRDRLESKEVSDELIIDMKRYTGHPDFKAFVAFVYDPKKYIDNPAELEDDLSELTGEMLVKVIVIQG